MVFFDQVARGGTEIKPIRKELTVSEMLEAGLDGTGVSKVRVENRRLHLIRDGKATYYIPK